MEQRLIDANALIEYLKKMWSKWDEDDWYEAQAKDAMKDDIEIVNKQPTVDAVPVRCKDCKWFKSGIDINGKPFTRCDGSVRTYGHTAPDWFCADGERKDGGNNADN